MSTHARPIVIPLDGSANAERALPAGIRLARVLCAPLRFIRVEPLSPPLEPSEQEASAAAFASYAGRLVSLHGGTDHPWSSAILTGATPGDAIVSDARNARMIVLCSHGEGGLRTFFTGSVADRVARSARVPVLIVPIQGAHQLVAGPILVALDGSELAEASLPLAREIARSTGQPLVLLQAWNPALPVGAEFAAGSPSMVEELAGAAQAYLARLRQPGEEIVALAGGAASAIREAADRLDASLVVVASHGKGRALRLALGSTTEILRRSLKRPLLVTPVAAARTPVAEDVAASTA